MCLALVTEGEHVVERHVLSTAEHESANVVRRQPAPPATSFATPSCPSDRLTSHASPLLRRSPSMLLAA
jgi:hypothetical protein